MSTIVYRVPFYSRLSGQVFTNQGAPVSNVIVTICHIDPVTGEADTDVDYCPLTTLKTDNNGYFTADIQISDQKFSSTTEYFLITPSKTDVLLDGKTTIEHVFVPANTRMPLDHLVLTSRTSFTDNTTVFI